MNYLNIHNNLIELCKNTTPIDRLISRNPSDVRLKSDIIYTEKHHIIPRHDGGTDDAENLVKLLPEEHYLIHLLRWKAYGNRKDFLAVRFMENGYTYKTSIDNKPFARKIGLHKQFVYEFRKNSDWHTKEGIDSISKYRKSKMPVKDAITGEFIGEANVDDPNVLSGKWVHHTKGTASYYDEHGNKVRLSTSEAKARNLKGLTVSKGSLNPNFKEMTDERRERLFDQINKSLVLNNLIVKLLLANIVKEFTEFKKISMVWVTNNFGTIQNLVDQYNSERCENIKYDPYFRITKTVRKNYCKRVKHVKN